MFNFIGKKAGSAAAPLLSAATPSAPAPLAPTPLASVPGAPGDADRRDLLRRISNFLLEHRLDVIPANLALAHAAVCGGNGELNRQRADAPVTQALLDDLASDAAQGSHDPAQAREREALDWLTAKLEQALEQIRDKASEASRSAADYHTALCATATSLEAARPAVQLPGLAQLTQAMIERTRTVEADMRQCGSEVTELRNRLQLARADAAMDRLTGMDNARTFAAVLEREYRAALAAGEPLSIAFCDIDRLQAINDAHGHETGDRVIRAIARVLQRLSGESCHIARHGGEEFVLLFRGLTPDEARTRLDQARETFAQRKLVDRKTHVALGSVTFSGGVADALAHGDPQAALKVAEEALLQAKEQGRNRIEVFNPAGPG